MKNMAEQYQSHRNQQIKTDIIKDCWQYSFDLENLMDKTLDDTDTLIDPDRLKARLVDIRHRVQQIKGNLAAGIR